MVDLIRLERSVLLVLCLSDQPSVLTSVLHPRTSSALRSSLVVPGPRASPGVGRPEAPAVALNSVTGAALAMASRWVINVAVAVTLV